MCNIYAIRVLYVLLCSVLCAAAGILISMRDPAQMD